MQDILKGLNEAQVEAVTSTEGYVRVIVNFLIKLMGVPII